MVHASLERDFSRSLALSGPRQCVIDANGNPVELVTVLGDSGFDFLHAAVAPVPAAGELLASSLPLVRLRRGAVGAD